MHARLFERQKELDEGIIATVAADIGLNWSSLQECRTPELKMKIHNDVASGRSLGHL
jgi:hypothetical protein